MNRKKIIYTSLLLCIIYIVLSFAYLHSGYAFANASKSTYSNDLTTVVEFFCLLPAISIDYLIEKPNKGWVGLSLLIYFVILWVLFFGIVYFYKLIKK